MSVTDSPGHRFGLLGFPLGHSLSPQIHQWLMDKAGISGSYELLATPLEDLPKRLDHLIQAYDGFNITIPYKQDVMAVIDQIDPLAKQIGAVNTVARTPDGRTIGYNTDLEGFLLDAPVLTGQNVLILGAGGVSRTLAFAAARAAARSITILARNAQKAQLLLQSIEKIFPETQIAAVSDPDRCILQEPLDVRDRWVILNGTPLGMWPKTGALPIPVELLEQAQSVYDTIYNPYATRLVLAAKARGIPAKTGLGMLVNQAILAQQYWHPDSPISLDWAPSLTAELTRQIYSHSPMTLVLTGFMGSGKSRIGRELSALLNWPLIDLDHLIETRAGQTIPEIFALQGEEAFRALEQQLLEEILTTDHCQILSTGGGALIAKDAQTIARSHPTLIIYLNASLDTIERRVGDGSGRPLIAGGDRSRLLELYQTRRPVYASLADLTIDADQPLKTKLNQILSSLGFGGNTP